MLDKKENTDCKRISCPTKYVEGRQVIDIENYSPYLLVAVNNTLSRGASRKYIHQFGIGIVEWRTMSMLAIEPGVTAARICQIVSLDKGATSRALKALNSRGNLKFEQSKTDERQKFWRLSEAGYDMHDEILKVALEREKQLICGVESEEFEVFLRVMRKMRHNVERIE